MSKKRKSSTSTEASSLKLRGRRKSSRVNQKLAKRRFVRFVLPAFIILVLSTCLVFLGVSGYQTAVASQFFGLRNVDIRGTERTSADEIRRIVTASVEKSGVWNADLSDLRSRIEKFPFVKSAAVSRVLPAGIRISVTERVPAAIVQLSSGNFLVDSEGKLLTAVMGPEKNLPFILLGWDEAKSERAIPDNLARLKVYKKMLEEWRQFDLSTRVKQVNLANPRQPVAVVEDSGRQIAVTVARDDLGKSLKIAIEAISGKGAKVKSVDAGGVYPIIQYLEF